AAALRCAAPDEESCRREVCELLEKAIQLATGSDESPYTPMNARQLRWRFPQLTEEDERSLEAAMDTAHITTGADSLALNTRLGVFINGARNLQDVGESFNTLTGMRGGAVYQAARDVAGILSKVVAGEDPPASLELLCGYSQGGGVAQYLDAVL